MVILGLSMIYIYLWANLFLSFFLFSYRSRLCEYAIPILCVKITYFAHIFVCMIEMIIFVCVCVCNVVEPVRFFFVQLTEIDERLDHKW